MGGRAPWVLLLLAALQCYALRAVAAGDSCTQLPRSEPRYSQDNWAAFQSQLAGEVAAADMGQGWDVLFSGDSVLEFLRGSVVGRPWGLIADDVQAFHDQIATHYNAHILAISGDYTSNLLWRVTEGGEMPVRQPKVVVVYIGSNDLSAADCGDAGESALRSAVKPLLARVRAIVGRYRQALPRSRVLLLGLMPRAGRYWEPSERFWPNNYTAALGDVNAGYQEIAKSDSMVTYLACGEGLAQNIQKYTMDGIHPTAAGYDRVLGCWRPAIDELFAAAAAKPEPSADAAAAPAPAPAPAGPGAGARPNITYAIPDLPAPAPPIRAFAPPAPAAPAAPLSPFASALQTVAAIAAALQSATASTSGQQTATAATTAALVPNVWLSAGASAAAPALPSPALTLAGAPAPGPRRGATLPAGALSLPSSAAEPGSEPGRAGAGLAVAAAGGPPAAPAAKAGAVPGVGAHTAFDSVRRGSPAAAPHAWARAPSSRGAEAHGQRAAPTGRVSLLANAGPGVAAPARAG